MRRQLSEEGYLIIKGFQDPAFIQKVAEANKEHLLDRQVNFFDTLGINWTIDPYYNLIYNEKIVKLMRDLEFSSPKFTGATFVNKKPFEPARPWHQDWWAWTFQYPDPPQIGILYYMTNTRIKNGCLRVIPRSHNMVHPIHSNYYNSHYTLRSYEREVSVELDVGDIVIIDTRLLHSTHENATGENRMGINVWYVPEFDLMPDELKAHLSYSAVDKRMGDFIPLHPNPKNISLSQEDYCPSINKLRSRLLFQ